MKTHHRTLLYVEREDGSYYFVPGYPNDLHNLSVKPDLFGRPVLTGLVRDRRDGT